MAQTETPAEQLTRLRETIRRHFDLEEFRTLCADLDVKYDDLPGEGLVARIRELVSHCERRDRLSELVQSCKIRFPKQDWGEAGTAQLFFDVPPLPPHALVGRDELLAELRARLPSLRSTACPAWARRRWPWRWRTTSRCARISRVASCGLGSGRTLPWTPRSTNGPTRWA